ncbi:hypothetical protein CHLRE_06g278295v5 [Chlamydomonas reinhardtii]|uniref:Uncharacterized protein n=1 Tax=Chlamydomonas reinhardtii TaxID=3055 RepID=A0A2K3DPF1_CHLRE|nr:uncharacterized protein CHLRE_06g278295v5 [Chlamydomonas reinhardtii]PNW82412.1 hypothetical protein CHLRE_06g278295v5 [Chlamydomonas reinhardtii]
MDGLPAPCDGEIDDDFQSAMSSHSEDREVYTPSSWFVYFGIEEVIRSQFFTNPAFCKERGKFRTDNPPGSAMWNGEH